MIRSIQKCNKKGHLQYCPQVPLNYQDPLAEAYLHVEVFAKLRHPSLVQNVRRNTQAYFVLFTLLFCDFDFTFLTNPSPEPPEIYSLDIEVVHRASNISCRMMNVIPCTFDRDIARRSHQMMHTKKIIAIDVLRTGMC